MSSSSAQQSSLINSYTAVSSGINEVAAFRRQTHTHAHTKHLEMLDDSSVSRQVGFSELALPPGAHPLEDRREDVERGDRKDRVSVAIPIYSAAATGVVATAVAAFAEEAVERGRPAAAVVASAQTVSITI